MTSKTQRHNSAPPTQTACRRRRLADSSIAAVDVCACGMMQLHLGAITLRMDPAAVSELLATLGRAVAVQAAHSAQERDEQLSIVFFPTERGDA